MWYAIVETKKRGKWQRALPWNKSVTNPGNLKKLQQCCTAENDSEQVFCKGKGLQVKELKTENINVKDQVYVISNCSPYSLQTISEKT